MCSLPELQQEVVLSVQLNTTSFPVNTTIRYKCTKMYVLESGDLERTCLATSAWSGNPPICVPFEVQLLNRTKYVAGGIAAAALLIALFLAIDFGCFLRKKMRIKRNSQRRQMLDSAGPRPLPFNSLHKSVLNQVYQGYHNEGYMADTNDYNMADKPPIVGKSKQKKKPKGKKAASDGEYSVGALATHMMFKRGAKRSTLQQLDQSINKVLSDSSVPENSQKHKGKKKKKKSVNKIESYAEDHQYQTAKGKHQVPAVTIERRKNSGISDIMSDSADDLDEVITDSSHNPIRPLPVPKRHVMNTPENVAQMKHLHSSEKLKQYGHIHHHHASAHRGGSATDVTSQVPMTSHGHPRLPQGQQVQAKYTEIQV